ncbi:DUF3558 family protein [Nocardia gipuzkoensis]|uniref:DUF3558 family protein n=1 Tax=Nocardia gipuzkoensis TaxID=2749991 RepID=UPI00237D5D08|nr:DUF3558 family protein [Nocardia gipuzkoensis]MDE1669153.1 DUF3558 family protein [Nocardia gipuzkoensis]
MRKPARIAIICALVCTMLGGCTRDEPAPGDTSSTSYIFDNVFNPCRQMPTQFLDKHHLSKAPESIDNRIEQYVSWGCSYENPEYDFVVAVSNAPLSEIPRFARHTFQETRISGRAAKIQNRPLEHVHCVLHVEMTGGILALYLTIKVVLDVCPTLTALAEELIPLLPPGV